MVDINQNELNKFIESAICSPNSLNEECVEWFGAPLEDLDISIISYISLRIFECECCKCTLQIEFAEQYNGENWCKWCIEEEPLGIAKTMK